MPKIKDLIAEPMMPAEKPVLLTPQELADYLKVSLWTLQRWRAEGTGPKYVRITNTQKYYRLSDVMEWIDLHTRMSSSDTGERV